MRKAVITVAENMSDSTFALLCNGITEKFGNDINFEKVIDNTIIGGFLLVLDGVVYDNTIAVQLKRLKKHIAE